MSKQTLPKRIEQLERLGHLATRPGPRRAKLVNAASLDRAACLTGDAVRALTSTGAPPAPISPFEAIFPVLAREQARQAAYDAYLKKLDGLERLGLVLPTTGVKAAVTQSAAAIIHTLDRLYGLDDDLLAAARDGRPGARRFLETLGHDLRNAMATALEHAMEMRKDEPLWEFDDIEVPPDALERSTAGR